MATLNQADSGHETLISDEDSPTPTVERASSEVIYSTISNSTSSMGSSNFARTRRSLAEPPVTNNMSNSNNGPVPIYEDIDQYHQHPPMIAPVSGVPNLKGKTMIRPIAFRPNPNSGNVMCMSGASTPTNPYGSFNGSLPPIPPNVPLSNRIPGNEGFAPGHPLIKDGRRHYGSSQELHVQQSPAAAAFNKFNSLDRRALARRHHTNLKLIPTSSGSESLPNPSVVGPTPTSSHSQPRPLNDLRSKEPERRHSSYDPTSRSLNRYRPLGGTNSSNGSNGTNANMGGNAIGQVRLSAMNINGLPDPFNQGGMLHPGGPVGPVTSMNGPSGPNTLTQRPQATHHAQPSIYSSQESLRSQVSVSRSNPPPVGRPGAGTPQFQNLSGVIRNPNSRGSLTNLNQSTNVSSSNYAVPSRSMSGSNLHHLDHHRLIDSGGSSTSSHGTMEMNQTPSPSDSAVGDLETVLKEKDTEINYLRETMEQNEQVIFKVYEEKEKMWEREIRKIKGLYDNRLRASQQKSTKMEQALTNQTYQLQSDKRRLEQELEDIKRKLSTKDKAQERLEQEMNSLKASLHESEWNSCAKSGEISFLQARMEDRSSSSSSNGSSNPNSTSIPSSCVSSSSCGMSENAHQELVELRIQVKDLRMELERRDSEMRELAMAKKSLQNEVVNLKNIVDGANEDYSLRELASQKEIIISRDQEIEKLQNELQGLQAKAKAFKDEADRYRESFETEKAHWLDEKEKVIRYQKQLQLNYVQMYKKNKTLEGEIEQLNKTIADQKKKSKSNLDLTSVGANGGPKVKKSNSVRAKFFKMSLHSESHC